MQTASSVESRHCKEENINSTNKKHGERNKMPQMWGQEKIKTEVIELNEMCVNFQL